jgi:hypothetical protein
MELDLMLVASKDNLSKWRRPRRGVLELVTAAIGEKNYGTTFDFLGVGVVFQDTGLIPLRTRLLRKRKEAEAEVELSNQWAKNASDIEIKLALLQSLIRAVGLVRERLRDDDDFDAEALVADLEALANQVGAEHPGLRERVIAETTKRGPAPRQEAETEDHSTLIVQYRTEGWGSPQDLQMRHRVESLLDECLKAAGNGYCDGGDIGSGTINIFLSVLDPNRAKDAVIEALRQAEVLEGATIAIETEEGFTVLWPQGFVGEFSYMY